MSTRHTSRKVSRFALRMNSHRLNFSLNGDLSAIPWRWILIPGMVFILYKVPELGEYLQMAFSWLNP